MLSSSTTVVPKVDWGDTLTSLPSEDAGVPVASIVPGEHAAYSTMETFLEHGLPSYDRLRNDPNESGQSGLSPYLHFGHLSPARLVERLLTIGETGVAINAFLEEVLVRRELAEN